MDSEFIEKIILKGILNDKDFTVRVSNVFEKRYFEIFIIGELFNACKNHIMKYNEMPSRSVLVNLVDDDNRKKAKEMVDNIDELDFSVSKEYKFLLESTNDYLKDRALKCAVMDVVDVINDKKEKEVDVRNIIEDALCKDLTIDMGTNYFDDMKQRLKKMFQTSDIKIPTYFHNFDEFLVGGFTPYTLSVMTSKVHGFKSASLANFTARQVLNGHNVALFTLEMSEEAFSQRFDAIYSLLDINAMYKGKENRKKLVKRLSSIKADDKRGNLFIKQFPTGIATINDYRSYLRELRMRDINPSIVYVDYINIMKSMFGKSSGDNLYSKVKSIAEELRALSYEFSLPIVSVSQLNRHSQFVKFEELDIQFVAESYGIPATADFFAIYGIDENSLIYESEVHYKISKNRFGGRVGSVDKFFYDTRTLKMYDSSEEDMWFDDAKITGDSRNISSLAGKKKKSKKEEDGGFLDDE